MPRIRDRVAYYPPLSTQDKKKRQTRFEHEPELRGVGFEEYAAYDAFAVEKLEAAFNKAMEKVAAEWVKMDDDFAKDDDTFSFGYGEI